MIPLYLTAVLFACVLQANCNPLKATPTGNAWTSQLDMLSLVTRYAGMGYNLLMANPEGDFYHAGIDPGIKMTRFIFKHTYSHGSQVFYSGNSLQLPDQVIFHELNSCAQSETTNVYSGQTSYKKELSVNTETSGK